MKSLEDWVREDHAIAARAESATAALMEHRWRAVNEGGVSIADYARALGLNRSVVFRYVKGWELVSSTGNKPLDAYVLASMSETKRAAVETVAEVEHVGAQTAERHYRPHVARARDVIERAPDIETGKRQARRQAERIREGEQRRQARHREHHRPRSLLNIEAELEKARRALFNALAFAREGGDLSEANTELLEELLRNVRGLLDLLNMAIVGAADVNWDAELARLREEER